MSVKPKTYITTADFEILRDAIKYYLDYLRHNRINYDYPKHYEAARNAELHLINFREELKKYPEADAIEIERKHLKREF